MKYIIAFIMLFMWSLTAYSQTSLTTNLTEAQKAALEEQAAKFRGQNASGALPGANAEKVDKWVDLGMKIGQALGGAAKELAIQVNDFAKTPVGILTMGLIVWHMIGGVFVHIIGGVIILISSWIFMLYINRKHTTVTIEYNPEKTDIFGRSRKVSFTREALPDDWTIGSYIWMAATTIVALMTIFTY